MLGCGSTAAFCMHAWIHRLDAAGAGRHALPLPRARCSALLGPSESVHWGLQMGLLRMHALNAHAPRLLQGLAVLAQAFSLRNPLLTGEEHRPLTSTAALQLTHLPPLFLFSHPSCLLSIAGTDGCACSAQPVAVRWSGTLFGAPSSSCATSA